MRSAALAAATSSPRHGTARQSLERRRLLRDHRLRRRVGVEDAVPTLRLVRRVADVVGIARLEAVIGMLGAAFTAPAPELRSRYGPTGFYVVERQLVDERVELVLVGRRRSRIEAAAVAGKPEFLHHQRLAQALGDGHLAPEIVARVLLDRRPGAGKILRVRPPPVLGPYMRRHVVDVRRRMRVAHTGVAV